MSEHKILVDVELDTSKAEKQLNDLTKNKKKVDIDVNVNDTKLDEIGKKAEKLKDKKVTVDTTIKGGKSVDNVSKIFENAKKSAVGFKNTVKGFGEFGTLLKTSQLIEKAAKNAVKAVEDIDKAIVDLQNATGGSYENVRQLVSGYNDFAKQLGATTTEVTSGADDFLRQGKSVSETNTLIKDSMVLSKLANMSSADSTKYLTAAMKGFGIEANDAMGIVDKFSSVDLVSATDAGGLAEGLAKVSASADLAGISMDKMLGYLAATGEASQEEMTVIGNAYKSIISRMGKIKAGQLELVDEDGTIENLSDVETVLDNVGIQLRSSNNEFRNFGTVIDETAMKWDNLSSVQKEAVSQAFAGQHHANRFKLLMQNYDKAMEYQKVAENSQGTALEKFNNSYLNSLEAKQKSLQASFESLSTNLISRDAFGGIVTATQALVEFLNQTNLVKGAMSGLVAGGMLKGFIALTTGITKASIQIGDFGNAMSLLKTGSVNADDLQDLVIMTQNLSKSQLEAVLSSKALSMQQRMAILMSHGMSEAEAEATLSTMGLATAEEVTTVSTFSLSSAFKGLWATMLANPILAIGVAVTAGVSVWNSYNQKMKETIQSAKDAGQAVAENYNSLQEQISKVQELKQALSSGNLSEEEAYQTKSQLLDIQNQLVATYGEQASGIDLLNGSLEKEISLMNQLSAQDANKFLNENEKGIHKAKDEMAESREYQFGVTAKVNPNMKKDIKNIVKDFEDSGIYLRGTAGGYFEINFVGNPNQADQTINEFLIKVRELKDEYENAGKDTGYLDKILSSGGEVLAKNKKIIDEYKELYDNALMSSMVSKGFGNDKPASIYNDYAQAVQKYNEALTDGDSSKIIQVKSEFDKVQSSVDDILKKYPEYQVIFDGVSESLDKSAIKMKDFQAVLLEKDFKDVISQFENLQDIDLKAMNLSDVSTSEAEKALKSVVDKALEIGIVSDDSAESIATVVDVLSKMGLTGTVSVTALTNSMEKANTSIQKATENAKNLQAILSESMSGEGLSTDSVKAFRDMFGSDAEKALERTSNGYHINTKALRELQKQQNAVTKTDYLNALSDQYTELRNIEAQIATSEVFGKDTSGLEASRNSILSNIDTLKDLQFQYESASSAYKQWQDSMSSGEEGDIYDSIYGNLEKAKGDYDKGLTGTNRFREYVDLMSAQDLSTASNDQIVEAYEKTFPKIKRYFTEGQEGAVNFLKDIQNINSEWAHMDKDGSWEINFGIGNDGEIAEKLDIDVEAVQAILRKLKDYGFDINLDQPISDMSELKSKAEEAGKSLADISVDLNVDSFEAVDKEITNVQTYIEALNDSEIQPNVKADKLNEANSILEYLLSKKQQLGQSEKIDVEINIDETQLNRGYTVLEKLKAGLSNIKGTVGIDYQGLQSEINYCVKQIEAMSPQMKVALGIHGMSIEQIKEGLMNDSIKIPVSANTSQAKTDVDSVKNDKVDDKKFTVTADTTQANEAIRATKSYLSQITSKTVTVRVNRVTEEVAASNKTSGARPGGIHKLNGTAKANGDWGNKRAGTSLVGELGAEIVVNPHTGTWYTVGDNGAEFVYIPQNAIVFNHKQSEELLKNGHSTGRGKALISGTAMSGGSGHLNAGGSGSSSSSTKKKTTTSSSKSSSSKSKSSSSSSNSSSKSEERDTTETFDWIARAIKRIETLYEKLKVTANSVYKVFSKRNSALAKEYANLTEQISLQQKAYSGYMSKANSIALPESYKKLVRDGAISIQDIKDENLQKQINEYQKYYDAAMDASTAVEELKENLGDLAKENFDNVATEFENKMSQIQNQSELIQTKLDHENKNSYGERAGYYKTLSDLEIQSIDKLQEKRAALQKSLSDALNTGAVEKYSEAWYEMVNAIADVDKAIGEANNSILDYNDAIRDMQLEEYENKLSLIQNRADLIDAKMKQTEAKGYMLAKEYYKTLSDVESNNLKQLNEEREALQNSLASALMTGEIKKDSDAWHEMCNQIADVDKTIEEANLSLIEFNKSMRDLDWDIFDFLQNEISKITDESDFLIDLLDKKKLFDDSGNMTNEGLATAGLHGMNYNVYMNEADKYAEEILKLNKELANDPSNQELIERRYELLEAQRENILAAEDEKNAIRDLVSDGIDIQLDAMQKLIDKRKEALRSEKDLYDYQKQISEQTKTVGSLEKQMDAYKGDTSEEGKKRLQELKVSLDKAKEDLKETEYEKFIADQEQLMDDLYTEYSDLLNMRLDDVDALLADIIAQVNDAAINGNETINGSTESINDALASVSEKFGMDAVTIYETLSNTAQSVGYELSEQMKNIWDTSTWDKNTSDITNVIGMYGDNFTNAMTTVNDTINGIKLSVEKMVALAEEEANKQIEEVKNKEDKTQNLPTPKPQPAPKPTPPAPKPPAPAPKPTPPKSPTSNKGSFFIPKRDSYPKNKLKVDKHFVHYKHYKLRRSP